MKKIYISIDMEGLCGCRGWDSVKKETEDYNDLIIEMTEEVLSVIKGIESNYPNSTYVIKDAHASGKNLLINRFPTNCEIIYGWDESPMSMIQGLDSSFDCSIFLGYHSGAGVIDFPLSHTYNSKKYSKVILNGEVCSEFTINYLKSWNLNVPVVMVSGDLDLCNSIAKLDDQIITIPTIKGLGDSITSKSTVEVNNELFNKSSSLDITDKYFQKFNVDYYNLIIEYYNNSDAIKGSFYPGIEKIDGKTVNYKCNSIDDIMIALMFI